MRKPGIIGNQVLVCVVGASFSRLHEVDTTRLRCADGNEVFLNQVVLLKILN